MEAYYDDDALNADSLAGFKKELIGTLKDFERKYVKHAKATNPVLAKIHEIAMKPVIDLTEASFNLMNFRKLSITREFPEFRKKALTEKFIEHLSGVCKIIKAFPNPEGKTLDEEYDIRHILELLDLPDWKDHPPFRFYLNPLEKAYDELVEELRLMHKAGPLRISYYVERNMVMSQKIMALVHQYTIVK